MTYWTVAWGVALGLAGYNLVDTLIGVVMNQYNTYKLNRVLDEMDWYKFDEPVKKKTTKKK